MTDRFEYLITTKKRLNLGTAIYSEGEMQNDLNKFGLDGWELVTMGGAAMVGNMLHVQFIFKRKIVETQQ
jgi:hypothetical protein